MKNSLIAATAVGVAIAGIILYSQRRTGSKPVKEAVKDAYNTMNDGIGKVERGALSMG